VSFQLRNVSWLGSAIRAYRIDGTHLVIASHDPGSWWLRADQDRVLTCWPTQRWLQRNQLIDHAGYPVEFARRRDLLRALEAAAAADPLPQITPTVLPALRRTGPGEYRCAGMRIVRSGHPHCRWRIHSPQGPRDEPTLLACQTSVSLAARSARVVYD